MKFRVVGKRKRASLLNKRLLACVVAVFILVSLSGAAYTFGSGQIDFTGRAAIDLQLAPIPGGLSLGCECEYDCPECDYDEYGYCTCTLCGEAKEEDGEYYEEDYYPEDDDSETDYDTEYDDLDADYYTEDDDLDTDCDADGEDLDTDYGTENDYSDSNLDYNDYGDDAANLQPAPYSEQTKPEPADPDLSTVPETVEPDQSEATSTDPTHEPDVPST